MKTADLIKQALQAAAEEISRDIATGIPDLTLHFIFYNRGQRDDQSLRMLGKFAGQSCESAVRDLIKHAQTSIEITTFIGLATGVEKSFLGLNKKLSFVGLAAINIDIYQQADEALADLYHVTAQALDTYYLVNRKTINHDGPDIVMQPKKNQLALSRSNLKSDIFSALMMHTNGMNTALRSLVEIRARRTLTPQSNYRPEDYPFVIALDLMKYAFKNLITQDTHFSTLLKLANKLAKNFEIDNLKSWVDFASPAQTMAWNGFTEEQILGYAVHTSDDPFVKSIGNLISEITQIQPHYQKEKVNAANPFIADEINQANHTKLTEEVFEVAIIHALEAESHLPLIRIANNQNEALLKGRMLGWCADALQAAAKTFEISIKKGVPPAPSSRVEFQTLAAKTDWSSMSGLNNYMVNQRRMGVPFTYDDIIQYCSSRFDLRPVINSLEVTLNELEYVQNLEMATSAPRPSSAAFAQSPEMKPSMHAAPSHGMRMGAGVSMGMGSGMGGMMGAPTTQKAAFQIETDGKKDGNKKAD